MRLLAPLCALALALPAANAGIAQAAFEWAAELTGSEVVPTGEVHTFDSWRWSDCGLPSDAISIESIEVHPDPPQPGKPLRVDVEAIANDVIEEGAYADVTVKLGLIKLVQKRFDVCEEARNANASVQCPVDPGVYTVSQTVDLPEEIPKAKFVINIRGYTADDDDMVCLDLIVDFMKPALTA